MKKLDFAETLKDSIAIGVKNAPSVVVAVALWLVTIWIPYINIGTTIAISLLPVELAKGSVINPLWNFRQQIPPLHGRVPHHMAGLMVIPIYIAILFHDRPGHRAVPVLDALVLFPARQGQEPDCRPSRRRTTRHTAASGQCFSSYWYSASSWVSCTGFSCSSARPSTSRFITFVVMFILLVLAASIAMAIDASFWKQLKDNVE